MDPGIRRVEQTCIDDRGAHGLALTGLVTVVDRSGDGDRREERVAGVPHVGPTPQGRVPGVTGSVLPLCSRECRCVLIGPGQFRPRALFVASCVAVDEPGIALPQRLVVDPEARRCARPPIRRNHIRSRDEPLKGVATLLVLEVQRDAALPSIGAESHMGPGPVGVVQGIDLDHVCPQVGQGPAREGPGDTQSEVEHPDAGQWGRGVGSAGLALVRRIRLPGCVRFGQDIVGVLARPGRRPGDRARGGGELKQRPGVPDAPELAVVHFDHAAVGQEGLVGQGRPGRANGAHPQSGARRGLVPLRGRKLLEGVRQKGMEEDPGQEPVRLHRHTIRVVAVGGIEPDRAEHFVLGLGQDPAGAQRPVMHPFAVSTLIDALDRPRVGRPHPVQRSIGILDSLPVERHGGQRALQERGRDVLAGSCHLARVEGRGQAQGGQIGRADTRPGRPGEDGTRAIRPSNEAFGRIELGVWARAATDVLHGGALPPLLVVEQAGPGGNQPVVTGAIPVPLLIAVARDRAGDHLGVELAQRPVVNAKSSGCPG